MISRKTRYPVLPGTEYLISRRILKCPVYPMIINKTYRTSPARRWRSPKWSPPTRPRRRSSSPWRRYLHIRSWMASYIKKIYILFFDFNTAIFNLNIGPWTNLILISARLSINILKHYSSFFPQRCKYRYSPDIRPTHSLIQGQMVLVRKKTETGWWQGELQAGVNILFYIVKHC